MQIDWRHKDIWTYRSSSFCVEISRHSEKTLDGTPEQHWCIYAYIWNTHPAFKLFNKDEGPFNQPSLEVHSYPSYYRPHIGKAGEVTAHQLGWDYNHDGDWAYSFMNNKDQAASVFADAQGLIKQLEDWGNED